MKFWGGGAEKTETFLPKAFKIIENKWRANTIISVPLDWEVN